MTSSYPLLVVPCKRGGIPCLTPFQARAILNDEERVISVSIFDANEYVAPCKKAAKGFAEFCGLEDFKTILTVQTPHVGMHAYAPATNSAVFGNREKGRISVSGEKWSEMVITLRPWIAIPLYDSVPMHESVEKRRRTAMSRSARWATLADSAQTKANCKLMKSLSVAQSGSEYVFVDELCQNETLEQYSCRVAEAVAKGQVMCTATSLPAVLICLKAGVCFIECALPWILAAKGIGLVFDLDPKEEVTPPRYETQIDLNDDCFAKDIGPLSPDCSCYTCSRHVRAYIHHLLTVQEMNSNILLVIHNLARLNQLIRLYRRSSVIYRELLLNWLFAQI